MQSEVRILPEELKKTSTCAMRHIEAFWRQAIEVMTADFGEPCENCTYKTDCDFDWISNLSPLMQQSGVKINIMAKRELNQSKSVRESMSVMADVTRELQAIRSCLESKKFGFSPNVADVGEISRQIQELIKERSSKD